MYNPSLELYNAHIVCSDLPVRIYIYVCVSSIYTHIARESESRDSGEAVAAAASRRRRFFSPFRGRVGFGYLASPASTAAPSLLSLIPSTLLCLCALHHPFFRGSLLLLVFFFFSFFFLTKDPLNTSAVITSPASLSLSLYTAPTAPLSICACFQRFVRRYSLWSRRCRKKRSYTQRKLGDEGGARARKCISSLLCFICCTRAPSSVACTYAITFFLLLPLIIIYESVFILDLNAISVAWATTVFFCARHFFLQQLI